MKKSLFLLASLALLVSACSKSDQDVAPEQEIWDADPQEVVIGSSITTLTKASVNNMSQWISETFPLYVFSVNDSTKVEESRVFIDNYPAHVTETETLKGNLTFDNDKEFFYGIYKDDLYSFYAYYLGYELQDSDAKAVYEADTLSIASVNVNGSNDIMIAETDKFEDAHISSTVMVNPKIVYSSLSARSGVKPNLKFNHQLSKFVFKTKAGAPSALVGKELYIDSVKMDSYTSGKLTLKGQKKGFVPQGDKSFLKLAMSGPYQIQTGDDFQLVGESLMLSPAGAESYTMYVYYREVFNPGTASEETKSMVLTKVINPSDVEPVVDSFDAGKSYEVNLVVYGLEAVTVTVELKAWEDAGIISVDPDAGKDAEIEDIVVAATNDQGDVFYLQFVGVAQTGTSLVIGTEVKDVLTGAAPADGVYYMNSVEINGETIDNITITSGTISAINS